MNIRSQKVRKLCKKPEPYKTHMYLYDTYENKGTENNSVKLHRVIHFG